MPLSFPFIPLSEVDLDYGLVPNESEVRKACPWRDFEYFESRNPWNELANILNCERVPEQVYRQWKIRAASQEEADMMWAYLFAWLMPRRLKVEHKIPICGWLLSRMLVELPDVSPWRIKYARS